MIAGLAERRIATEDAEIHVAVGGSGPPLLLLHGYPETHVCWHKVVPGLLSSFTVVCPDLRGYGDSRGPAAETPDHAAYSKRAMARDQVAVMAALGHARFAVAGHDRGGRVAYRLALDHPANVARLAVLDMMPTLEMFEHIDQQRALSAYHWLFLAQPFDLPERLIGKDPDFYLEWTLKSWLGQAGHFTEEAMAEYRRAFRRPSVVHASCEDYRAGATIDCVHDRADRAAGRRITCPLLTLWGGGRTIGTVLDPINTWKRWADDVRGEPLPCGHFIPEEQPDRVVAEFQKFFGANR
jgi:haloacetate dehalogenase